MDGFGLLIAVALLGIVIVLAIRVFSAPGAGQMARRGGRLLSRAPASAPARQPTLDDLRPGDAVSFWNGDDEVVETVIECREELEGRTARWRWVILSGGRVIEVAPDQNALYTDETIFYQGSEPFHELTADPIDGGALKTFESRVRDQTIARNPVSVTLDGKSWTVESTGTFLATFVGPPPRREVWRDISSNPADNVYFELRGADDVMAVGVWTSHIVLLEGRPLGDTDIQDLYPGAEEEQRA